MATQSTESKTPKIVDWSKSTYSGVDVSVIATLNFGTLQETFLQNSGITNYNEDELKKINGLVYELGTAQTISCQAHRPKVAV